MLSEPREKEEVGPPDLSVSGSGGGWEEASKQGGDFVGVDCLILC